MSPLMSEERTPPQMTSHRRRDGRAPLRVEEIASAHAVARVRQQLHDWLTLDVPSSVVNDLVLVVYEALANTVEHAYVDHLDGTGPVRLEACRTDGQLLITVSDEGIWRTPTGDDPFRGRGLALMRRLAHEVTVDSDHNGTVVHLIVNLDTPPPPATE